MFYKIDIITRLKILYLRGKYKIYSKLISDIVYMYNYNDDRIFKRKEYWVFDQNEH